MLNDWFSNSDEICADNYKLLPVQIEGQRRSEKWQIYLYGDKSMAVKRQGVLSGGVPPPGNGDGNVLLRRKFHASRSVRFKLGQCGAHDRRIHNQLLQLHI